MNSMSKYVRMIALLFPDNTGPGQHAVVREAVNVEIKACSQPCKKFFSIIFSSSSVKSCLSLHLTAYSK